MYECAQNRTHIYIINIFFATFIHPSGHLPLSRRRKIFVTKSTWSTYKLNYGVKKKAPHNEYILITNISMMKPTIVGPISSAPLYISSSRAVEATVTFQPPQKFKWLFNLSISANIQMANMYKTGVLCRLIIKVHRPIEILDGLLPLFSTHNRTWLLSALLLVQKLIRQKSTRNWATFPWGEIGLKFICRWKDVGALILSVGWYVSY